MHKVTAAGCGFRANKSFPTTRTLVAPNLIPADNLYVQVPMASQTIRSVCQEGWKEWSFQPSGKVVGYVISFWYVRFVLSLRIRNKSAVKLTHLI